MDMIGQSLSQQDKDASYSMLDLSSNVVTDAIEQWWSLFGLWCIFH
jgi:hypothetical protein